MIIQSFDWNNNVNESNSITSESIRELFSCKIALIVVKDFYTNNELSELNDKISTEKIRWIVRHTRMGRFGLTAREQRKLLAEDKGDIIDQVRAELNTALGERFVERIKQIFNIFAPTELKTEQNFIYAAPIIRYFPYADYHTDFVPQQDKDWNFPDIIKQFSVNLHLSDHIGNEGSLRLAKREYDYDDDKYAIGDFGYSEEIVKGYKLVSYIPKKGDLVIINTQNYHCFTQSSNLIEMIGLFGALTKSDSEHIYLWP